MAVSEVQRTQTSRPISRPNYNTVDSSSKQKNFLDSFTEQSNRPDLYSEQQDSPIPQHTNIVTQKSQSNRIKKAKREKSEKVGGKTRTKGGENVEEEGNHERMEKVGNGGEEEAGGITCCRPQSCFTRALALLLMSLLGFGSFFCFDNPGALQSQMVASMNLTGQEFSGLYSWYSWPNVVLPILSGSLIDGVLGVRLGTILFTCLLLAGQLLLSLGTILDSLHLVNFARLVFGLGGESLLMALNTYTVAWFKGRELNCVFGLQNSVSRLGSSANFLVMGPVFAALHSSLATRAALGLAFLLAAVFPLLSFSSSLILAWLDKRREAVATADDTQLSQVKTADHQGTTAGDSKKLRCRDCVRFPISFWLLCCCILSYYGAMFPFISFAQGFFKTKFDMDEGNANILTGLVYMVSAVGSPLFGYLIDRTGRTMGWVLAAMLLSIVGHVLLCLPVTPRLDPHLNPGPYVATVLMGLGYSVVSAALWSMAALIVSETQLGTAYGIMQALQNLGVAVITVGAGYIVDAYSYDSLEPFFIGWLVVATLSGLSLWQVDLRLCGGRLNRPAASRSGYTEL